jgi:proline utilization trans-activator
MLTTRPIFFPCLRAYHEASKKGCSAAPRPLSDLVEGLSEACVNAARTSSSIIAQLWTNGDLATFGFFDALSIFSSTLILMMASTIQYKAQEGDHDRVVTSLSLLKDMRDGGNMPAHNYYDQLVQLKRDLDHAAEQVRGNHTMPRSDGDQSHGIHLPVAASGGELGIAHRGTPGLLHDGQTSSAIGNYDTARVLNDPYIQNFLNQQQPYVQSLTDAIPSFPPDDFSGYFDFDILDVNEQNTLWMS